MNIRDIIIKDGVEHIVVLTDGKSPTATMPLQEYVMECRVVLVGNEYITIRELIDREMERIRNHKI